MEKLISIIVPIYKVENYLIRCIESIVCQTYENIEIILVDDGSPDKCPMICDEWAKKDERIKVIHIEYLITAAIVQYKYPNYVAMGELEKDEVKQINCRIRDLFTSKLGGVIVNSADTVVISAFLGLTKLAIYQNYYFIIT